MKTPLLILLVACGNSSSPDDRQAPAREKPAAVCKANSLVCAGDQVVACENGKPGRTVTSCRGGCKQGKCVDTCGANDVELIYVVDSGRSLFSFDPKKLPNDPFRKIGSLSCDPESSPFSMAVDRTGIAWVLYHTGVLYQVSLIDAHCFSQAAPPDGAPKTFGMGFVTDGPKATAEKLYVAGDNTGAFATINTQAFPTRWTEIATVNAKQERSPELTGTSEGRLYAYFPGEEGRGFIQELDRNGTGIGKRWELPRGSGRVAAWAFAFWGDVFYVFLTLETVNEVHAIHRKNGKHEIVVTAGAHRIVGAGVSTCAPLLEQPL